jgi:hypothetical protein
MKPASELEIKKMQKDIRTPVVVILGLLGGNFATNVIIPKVANFSGLGNAVEGVLGAEITEQTGNIIKVALPILGGLLIYQLVENRDAKNAAIGVTGSGILNGANMLLNSKVPALAKRVLSVQGLGSDNVVKPQSVKEFDQMINAIDKQLSLMTGTEQGNEIDFSGVDDDFAGTEIDFSGAEDVEYEEISFAA